MGNISTYKEAILHVQWDSTHKNPCELRHWVERLDPEDIPDANALIIAMFKRWGYEITDPNQRKS